MDYIRKEVERFIRNDVRTAKKNRKITSVHVSSWTQCSDFDTKTQTLSPMKKSRILRPSFRSRVSAASRTSVNAISASGGKTWKTYIPGKIAFDSEVATLVGKTGIAFATIEDARVLTDTPSIRLNAVDCAKAAISISSHRHWHRYSSKHFGTKRCRLLHVSGISIATSSVMSSNLMPASRHSRINPFPILS